MISPPLETDTGKVIKILKAIHKFHMKIPNCLNKYILMYLTNSQTFLILIEIVNNLYNNNILSDYAKKDWRDLLV